MAMLFDGVGGNTLGRATATAGTVINHLVPPSPGRVTRVSTLKATAAGTAHTVTCLRPLGQTTASAAAASGQAVVNFTADPGAAISNAIAANDWVAIRHSADGVTRLYQVSSVSTLAITMTGNMGAAVAAKDKIWFFGVAADTDPRYGAAHPTFAVGASAQTALTDQIAGVIASIGKDEPILIQDNNTTAAGSLDQTSYCYTAA